MGGSVESSLWFGLVLRTRLDSEGSVFILVLPLIPT